MRTHPLLVWGPLFLGALSSPLVAQHPYACQLAADIHPLRPGLASSPRGDGSDIGGVPRTSFVRSGSRWFFTAETPGTGRELCVTDGSSGGTSLVMDIRPGSQGSEISQITSCRVGGRDLVFFAADDGVHGMELWISDGSLAGTSLIKDLKAGPNGSPIHAMAALPGCVLFCADDGVSGAELWISDGTANGTVLLRDLRSGASGSLPQSFLLAADGRQLFFTADDGVHGRELWLSDGTSSGTKMIADVWPGPTGGLGSGPALVLHQGHAYFEAADPWVLTRNLWRSDGTAKGTIRVASINAPSYAGRIDLSDTASLGSILFFTSDNGSGIELWRTDGTSQGTRLVRNINTSAPRASSTPRHLTTLGAYVYFSADDGRGAELWRSDGSFAGTTLVKDVHPGMGGSRPSELTVALGRLVFSADDGTNGRELWVSDGSSAGTTLLENINVGRLASSPSWFTALSPTRLVFVATSSIFGTELFVTDGSPNGMSLLKDLDSRIGAPASSRPSDLHSPFGNGVIFAAKGTVLDKEPFFYSPGGQLQLLKDINPEGGSFAYGFTSFWNGEEVQTLFAAKQPATGYELWVTDGTPTGTRFVREIRPGPTSNGFREQVAIGNRVYFSADDGVSGFEPWVSDGTQAGTYRLADVAPGSLSSNPRSFTRLGSLTVFWADNGALGHEPWVTNGSPTGTRLLRDIAPAFRRRDWLPLRVSETASSSAPRMGRTAQNSGRRTAAPRGLDGSWRSAQARRAVIRAICLLRTADSSSRPMMA
jgi:ELWxxDGT repeat protein